MRSAAGQPPPPVRGPLACRGPGLVAVVYHPGRWLTVTGPSSSAPPARAWASAPEPGNRHPGPRASRHHQLAGARGRLRCDEMAPGGGAHPGRNRRRAGHHHPGSHHARAGAGRQRRCCAPPSTGTRSTPPGPATDPGPAATAALAWARRHSLPLAALADPQVTRHALDALTLRLDGTRAAATTITRKRAVFHDCLGYAAELGLLQANPLDRISWRPPRAVLRGGPAVSRQPRPGAGDPGRGRQDPPGADRVLRLPVLRRAAPRRSRRAADRLLHSSPARLGTADPHGVPSPVRACLDRQRHATRTAQPQTPPRRRHQDSPDPAAACPSPPASPAGSWVRRRRAAVPGCPRRPAQRKPLRQDLAPGPRRGASPGLLGYPAPAPVRPSSCGAVAVAGLRCPAGRGRRPRRAQRACSADHLRSLRTGPRPDRQPAHRASPPRTGPRPAAGPQQSA